MTKTEGIRYTGSKREIIDRILDMIQSNCSDIKSILDGCSGTTRVSQALKMNGYSVTSNDLSEYSSIFGCCYLLNQKPMEHYSDWIDHLNNLKGIDGWFSENYGGLITDNKKGNAIQSDGKKRPWQIHNTQKLDAILREIPLLTKDKVEQSVLLTSTILAMDKVDNTMGHQVSYLKKWAKRTYDEIQLSIPQLIPDGKECFVSKKSIFDIDEYYDLVYLDPPYGTNNQKTKTTRVRYRSYYHLWNTVCLNDKPELVGASLRRKDSSSDLLPDNVSVFESTDHSVVYKSTKDLIDNLNCRYVLFSYANKAKLSESDLREIFSEYKIIEFSKFNHKENAMKHSTINSKWLGDQNQNKEFLILVEKQ
jgi:adenine-specific DNA-methyltransferase